MKKEKNIDYLESRDKQLWFLTLLLFLLIAAFLFLLTLQYTSLFGEPIENKYFYAFTLLILLFIVYLINNQTHIKKLRKQIEEEKKKTDALKEQSIRENLLSLGTKNHFEDCLAMEFRRSQISSAPFSVLVVAVKNLAEIDKKYGFGKGNELICDVTRSLRNFLSEGNSLFRYSNQIYTSILPETDKDKMTTLTKKINDTLSKIRTEDGELLEISINSASFPADAESLHDLRKKLFEPFCNEAVE
ncbi:MAG: diguanylate cyclase [Candidatus Schekmanbacteria bacterium]|nr:MAG: diguanylate cyclase [Candidatus Schekmanbacteria bacterium]